jgi:phosphomannomutase
MPASGQTAIRSAAGRSIGEAWILDEEKKKIVSSLEHATGSADLQPEQTLGDRIEDRGSQITFSGLGQHPPLEEKKEWDPRKSRAYFRRN